MSSKKLSLIGPVGEDNTREITGLATPDPFLNFSHLTFSLEDATFEAEKDN